MTTTPAKLNEYNQTEEPARRLLERLGWRYLQKREGHIIRARLSNHTEAPALVGEGMVENPLLVTCDGPGIAEDGMCRLLGRTP